MSPLDVISYAAAKLAAAPRICRRAIAALHTGYAPDQNWVLTGDSTADQVSEWFYLTAVGLGARYPNIGVKYADWSGGTSFNSQTTLQTAAAGYPTLNLWNASVSGTSFEYSIGKVLAAAEAKDPDVLMVSFGHNEGTNPNAGLVGNAFRNRLVMFTAQAQQRMARAKVVLFTQNPQVSPANNPTKQEQRREVIQAVAGTQGYDVCDVLQEFLNLGDDLPNWLESDGVHPKTSGAKNGSQLWANKVLADLRYQPGVSPTHQERSSLERSAGNRNLLANGDFQAWSSTDPDSWTPSANTTLTKDTTNKERTGGTATAHSARLQPTSTAASAGAVSIQQSVTDYTRYRNRWVTATARFYAPAGQDVAAGRIKIQDGSTSTSSQWLNNLVFNAGTFLYVSCSHFVVPAAGQLTVFFYGDTGTTPAVGGDVSFQRVTLVPGVLPMEL